MPDNPNNRRREETHRNYNSDMQNSNTQGHMINNVPNSQEQTGNIKQTTINGNIDKPDESINTQICYGRLSRKLDRFTYHQLIAKHYMKIVIILCMDIHTFTDSAYYNIMLLEEGG